MRLALKRKFLSYLIVFCGFSGKFDARPAFINGLSSPLFSHRLPVVPT